MKAIFKRNEVVIFEKDFPKYLSDEEETELSQFDNEPINSLTIKFNDGVIVKIVNNLSDLESNYVESITINLI